MSPAATLARLRREHCLAAAGYDDAADWTGAAALPGVPRRVVGGGIILGAGNDAGAGGARGPALIHVVPHSGTSVPPEYLAGLRDDGAALSDLAALVVQNTDLGTGYVAQALARSLMDADPRGPAVYVAHFGVSRLFLDANRRSPADQVPLEPYVGSGAEYRDFLREHGAGLRADLLLPWLDAVNALIRAHPAAVVFHHHSFDVTSLADRVHDLAPKQFRPFAETFWARPAADGTPADEPDAAGLAPRPVIRAVAAAIESHLGRHPHVTRGTAADETDGTGDGPTGATDPGPPRVGTDHPLVAPPMPFAGALAAPDEPADRPWHILYEVRRDLMASPDGARAWLDAVAHIIDTVTALRAGEPA